MNGMITVAKKSNNIDFIKYSYSIGVRDFRLNMDYEKEAYESIELIQSLKLEDAKIFADYQGVKMRIQLKDGIDEIKCSVGDTLFIYNSEMSYPYISNYYLVQSLVKVGNVIRFADDKIEGVVKQICDDGVWIKLTKVEYVLRQNAGCCILGEDVPSPHMTKDICQKISNTKAIRENLVDWVILSFVENAEEIQNFVIEMHKKGIWVMAKIETDKGVENIDSIGLIVDGFMIGRGDLKNTTKEDFDSYYMQAICKISKFTSRYNGVGTFFLAKYSQTLELTEDQVEEILNVKKNNFNYIMLSKEVVNSKYPYEAIAKLQQICQN